jgi:hypothetical protein
VGETSKIEIEFTILFYGEPISVAALLKERVVLRFFPSLAIQLGIGKGIEMG